MPYICERFEYTCPKNHRNESDFAYAVTEGDMFSNEPERPRLPEMLPCSGCNYKLVAASLVPILRLNYSESDFGRFQEAKYTESSAYHEAGHVVIAAVEKIPLRKDCIRIDQKGAGYSHYKTMSGGTIWCERMQFKILKPVSRLHNRLAKCPTRSCPN
jgi:hypothetical protein